MQLPINKFFNNLLNGNSNLSGISTNVLISTPVKDLNFKQDAKL